MGVPTSGRDFNVYRDKRNKWVPLGYKGKFLHFLQLLLFFLRDDGYFNWRTLRRKKRLEFKIHKDTFWLCVDTHRGKVVHKLTFREKAIKYYEYKNMVVQQRAQWVIIFLTIALLVMTFWEIYLQFLR